MEISGSSGSLLYLELLQTLISRGERTAPRGVGTLELRDVTIIIADPLSVHVLETQRRPRAAIAATEAAQLIAGVSSLPQLDLASGGRFSQFADGGRLRGAYGPRSYEQFRRCVALLSRDPATRQAVISVWTGSEDSSTHDVPCTLSLQFFIRDDRLLMRTAMRSNDVYLGLPYDWEVFSAVHRTLAGALQLQLGSYTHTVGSLHLYERDRECARELVSAGLAESSREPIPPVSTHPALITSAPSVRWEYCAGAALDIIFHRNNAGLDNRLRAYVPQLPSGTHQQALCQSCRYIVDGWCPECDA